MKKKALRIGAWEPQYRDPISSGREQPVRSMRPSRARRRAENVMDGEEMEKESGVGCVVGGRKKVRGLSFFNTQFWGSRNRRKTSYRELYLEY